MLSKIKKHPIHHVKLIAAVFWQKKVIRSL